MAQFGCGTGRADESESQLATGVPWNAVAFSPDGVLIAAGGDDGTVRLFEPATDGTIARGVVHATAGAMSIAFSDDGSVLAAQSDDDTVGVYDVASAAEVWRRPRGLEGPPEPEDEDRLERRLLARFGSLDRLRPDIPTNAVASGGPLVVPADGPLPVFPLPGGPRVTLLSPTAPPLLRAVNVWRRSLANAGIEPPRATAGAARERDRTSGTSASPTGQPPPAGQVANDASLAFLVEYSETAWLIPGDTSAEVLAISLARLIRERGVDRIRVDVMVLSRNGSARNISAALLGLIDCDRFVVSTDGSRFRHPDAETIQLLGQNRSTPALVHFNYRSPMTEGYADPAVQRRLNIVAVFPEGDAPLTLSVEPRPIDEQGSATDPFEAQTDRRAR